MALDVRPKPTMAPQVTHPLSRRGDRSRARSASVLLFVPALLLALYFVDNNSFASDYAPAKAARSNNAIVIIGPYVAACAAWEMTALRTVWGRLPVLRGWLAVLTGRLGLVAGCGLAAMAISYLSWTGSALFTDWPGWSYPLLSVAGVLAWTVFGAAAGLLLRPVFAVPIAVCTCFFALSLPQSWTTLWPRHLNGYLDGCCSTSEVLDPRAVRASLAVLAAVAVVSLAIAAVRLATQADRAPLVLGIGAVLSIGAVLVASAVAAPARELGALPTKPRPATELVCQAPVCMWPEDGAFREANAAAWAQVSGIWREAGLPLERSFVGPINTDTVYGAAATVSRAQQAAQSMAVLLPRLAAGCPDVTDPTREERLLALTSYLLVAMGESPAELGLLDSDKNVPTRAEVPTIWRGVPCS